MGHLGTVERPPLALEWDASMLPAQQGMAARGVVHFWDLIHLVYETPVTNGLATTRQEARVRLIAAQGQPAPFWSRAGREMHCALPLDIGTARIERAVLHVVVWDGGQGGVGAPFALNDQPLPVLGGSRHDVLYRQVEVGPALLLRGENTVRVLSDTEHHGIEVLRPGPALVVRYRGD